MAHKTLKARGKMAQTLLAPQDQTQGEKVLLVVLMVVVVLIMSIKVQPTVRVMVKARLGLQGYIMKMVVGAKGSVGVEVEAWGTDLQLQGVRAP